HPESKEQFDCFSVKSRFTGKQLVFDQLLCQCTTTCTVIPAGEDLECCTHECFWYDPVMFVEVLIFSCHDSIYYIRVYVFVVDSLSDEICTECPERFTGAECNRRAFRHLCQSDNQFIVGLDLFVVD